LAPKPEETVPECRPIGTFSYLWQHLRPARSPQCKTLQAQNVTAYLVETGVKERAADEKNAGKRPNGTQNQTSLKGKIGLLAEETGKWS
jgi:hypothetical protein